jgi:transcriptional regulator with XRE-family HTH domain
VLVEGAEPMKPNEVMKRQRERLGLLQREVAEKAGLTRDGYALIEMGKRASTYRSLFAIAQVLNLPPEALQGAAEAVQGQYRSYWPTEAAFALCGRKADS